MATSVGSALLHAQTSSLCSAFSCGSQEARLTRQQSVQLNSCQNLPSISLRVHCTYNPTSRVLPGSCNPQNVSCSATLNSLDITARGQTPAEVSRISASALGTASSQVVDAEVSADEDAMVVVDVDLGDRSYPIYIGAGILDQGELLRRHVKGKKVLVVTNETVAPLYLERTLAALTNGGAGPIQAEAVILPDGEQYKNMGITWPPQTRTSSPRRGGVQNAPPCCCLVSRMLPLRSCPCRTEVTLMRETLMRVYDKALETRMDRKCTFVALGGGVVGDMCGFAAATYLRGVDFIQIPTTLMAQVDSSVGGKTGVNHPLGKNMIGAFYQPQCVLVDTRTLATLPDRELASGVAEVVKYGLIRDAAFFAWQERHLDALLARDPAATAYAVKRSCENKAEVVAADEKESGLRATLNLGHTFGHVMAADMSHRLGWIDASLLERTTALLRRARLPVDAPPGVTIDKFKSLMAVDKKVADGLLRLILLKGPLGSCVFTGDFDPSALEATLKAFCKE
eukprot:jgi/Mesen1/8491/ME000480S07847